MLSIRKLADREIYYQTNLAAFRRYNQISCKERQLSIYIPKPATYSPCPRCAEPMQSCGEVPVQRLRTRGATSRRPEQIHPIMQRLLLILGCLLIAAAAAWPWLSKLPLGRLPGDIHIVRDGFSFYFPITTCILVSVLVSVVIWVFRR